MIDQSTSGAGGERDPETMLEAWTLIGKGIGYLGTGLSYFFVKKKRVAALLWPVALGVTTILWFQVGAPLLEQFVADKVKIEKVSPVSPGKEDSLSSEWPQTGESILAGTMAGLEQPEAAQGKDGRKSGNSEAIRIGGQVYGQADPDWQLWKLEGAPAILAWRRSTGEVFKIESEAFTAGIKEKK